MATWRQEVTERTTLPAGKQIRLRKKNSRKILLFRFKSIVQNKDYFNQHQLQGSAPRQGGEEPTNPLSLNAPTRAGDSEFHPTTQG